LAFKFWPSHFRAAAVISFFMVEHNGMPRTAVGVLQPTAQTVLVGQLWASVALCLQAGQGIFVQAEAVGRQQLAFDVHFMVALLDLSTQRAPPTPTPPKAHEQFLAARSKLSSVRPELTPAGPGCPPPSADEFVSARAGLSQLVRDQSAPTPAPRPEWEDMLRFVEAAEGKTPSEVKGLATKQVPPTALWRQLAKLLRTWLGEPNTPAGWVAGTGAVAYAEPPAHGG
jgi:hypothetical protein